MRSWRCLNGSIMLRCIWVCKHDVSPPKWLCVRELSFFYLAPVTSNRISNSGPKIIARQLPSARSALHLVHARPRPNRPRSLRDHETTDHRPPYLKPTSSPHTNVPALGPEETSSLGASMPNAAKPGRRPPPSRNNHEATLHPSPWERGRG